MYFHRVPKFMRTNKLKAHIGYKRCYCRDSKLQRIVNNILERQFNPGEPNKVWMTNITYIRTYEGLLYVATVMHLSSRWTIGRSMDKNRDKRLVINAC